MGNWRTVHIQGTCHPDEVKPLREWLDFPKVENWPYNSPNWDRLGPLTISHGLGGLGEWPAPKIDAIGSLFERDYSVESIAEHLRKLVEIAPSLKVMIDCGGDYESTDCVATIIVGEDSSVAVLPPKVEYVSAVNLGARMLKYLSDARHWNP